jgi:hypothetical protein
VISIGVISRLAILFNAFGAFLSPNATGEIGAWFNLRSGRIALTTSSKGSS